ncbi:MAG: glycosyltransferase [Maledivibacter sp.]|jgi:glycosyltransferase involved in cell wall biosynthesis|nr:glycosyltransferase [Maledivibacter sp.]
MGKKVCIVTPDLVGPIKNGGVGTYAYYLALELTKNNYITTILFTGPCFNHNNKYWTKYYEKLNIEYLHINELQKPEYDMNNDWFLVKSYVIYEYLKKKDYDFVHFQEWKANGFHTIQGKKNHDNFQNTQLTVTMHSSTQWINQGMHWWNNRPTSDTKLEWCERYCCKNCDLLISPSKHMFDWAKVNGWELNENRSIIPYCFQNHLRTSLDKNLDLKHLIFFGRLETRKGLEIFCDSVVYLKEVQPNLFSEISFIGKNHECNGIPSNQFIGDKFKNIEINYNIYSNFNSFEAIQYLKEQNGIAVIPSKLDNYPFTVIECIENKISFIASNVGGIPEMVNKDILFEPTVDSLSNKLLDLDKVFDEKIIHRYSKEKASQYWLELHRKNKELVKDHIKEKLLHDNPLVSICIPYYNYGQYLPQLLKSISMNTYKNHEVIVVDDGSTEEESIEVFANMRNTYDKPNWTFLHKENGGIGNTRNFAAENAKGDYIIFMDADNIAFSNMIYDFIYGIYKSKADCLTCHYNVFKKYDIENNNPRVEYRNMPIGAALESGILQNVFGDANFIIRKKVFFQIGGFTEERTTSWEDYDFLIRLNLLGYKQDVIPESLFWYRLTEDGFSRNTNLYDNQQRVLKAYHDNSPNYVRFLLNSLILPLHYKYKESHRK